MEIIPIITAVWGLLIHDYAPVCIEFLLVNKKTTTCLNVNTIMIRS
jgi:hypothetical protein